MSKELKPCGSCGSVEAEIGNIGGATYWVECSACGACSSSHDDEYDAITAWNRRPIEDKLQDRIDALEWLREVEEALESIQGWHPQWQRYIYNSAAAARYDDALIELANTVENARAAVES